MARLLLPLLSLLALSGCLGFGEEASSSSALADDAVPSLEAVPIPEVDSQPLPPL